MGGRARKLRTMINQTALRTSVLVVDDEPQVVWVLQFSLEAEGYTTYAARDGRWSVLEEMMQLPREERPRVVVVSAMANLRDRAKAAEMGADAFMPKPFNVDDLLGVLQDLERAS